MRGTRNPACLGTFDPGEPADEEYFEEQGVPELTPHAACNMDYRLADVLGADLTRTQTIADGAEYCDFR